MAVSIVQALAVACACYITAVILLRLLSPLRKIPGPNLAKVGVTWHLWHMLKGDYAWAMVNAHRKYGPLVRVAHNEVSVCTPDAVKTVLTKALDKSAWYKIFAIPDSSWTNQMCELSAARVISFQRKINSGYALSNVINAEPEFDASIEQFKLRIEEEMAEEKSVRFDKWFAFFAFDIVGLATFSRAFGFLEQGIDVGGCIATSHALVTYLSFMTHFYQWHDVLMMNPLIKYYDLQPMRHVMKTTEKAVQQRQETDIAGSDMMEHWKRQKPGEELTPKELLSTANANVAAGADTVGSEMQAFVYYMLKHPAYLKKLQDELDAAANRGELSSPVRFAETQKLPYFQACMKEMFRIHPVSCTSYPRIVPQSGMSIAGTYLPEGTIVSINAWALHRDPSIWGSDVDDFKPARWLQEDGPAFEKYLIAFGAGYMQCPGRHLALIQLNKLIATLFLDYDISFTPGQSEWKIARAFVMRPYGWSCQMRRREIQT